MITHTVHSLNINITLNITEDNFDIHKKKKKKKKVI